MDTLTTSRRVTSLKQLDLLVDYMGRHREFALSRVRNKEMRDLKTRMWKNLTAILNVADGPQRSAKEWSRNELKSKARAKTIKIKEARKQGTEYSGPELTGIEERVMQIMCPGATLEELTKPDSSFICDEDMDQQEEASSYNMADFYEVKVQDDESDLEPDNDENPLKNNDTKSQESKSSIRSKSLNNTDKKQHKTQRKNPRKFCRKFKRREILNEFDVFGKHVALQMKLLSTEQAIIAQREIQNVLTQFRLECMNNGRSGNDGRSQDHVEFIETFSNDDGEINGDESDTSDGDD